MLFCRQRFRIALSLEGCGTWCRKMWMVCLGFGVTVQLGSGLGGGCAGSECCCSLVEWLFCLWCLSIEEWVGLAQSGLVWSLGLAGPAVEYVLVGWVGPTEEWH